jgi:Rod binding domain-containing protein
MNSVGLSAMVPAGAGDRVLASLGAGGGAAAKPASALELRQVAEKFEAILIQSLVHNLQLPLGGDPADPAAGEFESLGGEALAGGLAAAGGLGLTAMILRAISPAAPGAVTVGQEKVHRG